MEKNDDSMEKHKCQELRIEIGERLKPAPHCCMYRVQKDLRKIKAAAYTPQFISVGPYHHGKKDLLEMEKQKLRYKREFGARMIANGANYWKCLVTLIEHEEEAIRDCYAETSKLQSVEFIRMILYDAIFIIELLLKKHRSQGTKFLLSNPWLKSGIWLDLQLLENQHPYFILKKIYNLAFETAPSIFGTAPPPSFFDLACNFFNCSMSDEPNEIKHFLDLRRNDLVQSHPAVSYRGHIEDLPSAVKLHETGVKLLRKRELSLFDITFKKRKLQYLRCFHVYERMVPGITIEDGTQCWIRNVMALEQCRYPLETHFCNYINLMDHLINTENDVDFLVEWKIITNNLGDHVVIARIFNKLCLQITWSDSCFKDISDKLNEHHNKWWNRTMGTLSRVYSLQEE